ncbi:MAG: formyltransferase family protein [Chitinophagia bacterium]|jgi:UDP-4-amino-4-deoxy-L-arabinose formyltransferase/UDP-glucuronic acid dehydrogenase (UDP-4-keto-hexauronic acid decarboxylating)
MRIGVIGRSEFVYDTMKKLLELGHEIAFIVTAKAAPEYTVTRDDFQAFAEKNNIPFLYDPRVKAQKIIDITSGINAEICISVNYSGVIEQEVVSLFPLGILNAHGGDLPKYRGNACQAWAIINGEERIGLCIHQMIGGELDSGPIIERDFFPLDINTRIKQVYEWIEFRIPDMMISAIMNLSRNSRYALEIQSTDPQYALRCYPRIPDDGRIEWDKSNIEIIRLINASSEPYSGAFTYNGGVKIIIWRANLIEHKEKYLAVPGQIASIDKSTGNVLVITGDGIIAITEIEVEGWRGNASIYFKSIRNRLK